MGSEFEFSSFHHKNYCETESNRFKLLQLLNGGWIDKITLKAYIMELKVAKIDDYTGGDGGIQSYHTDNLKEAEKWLKTYKWTKTDCKKVQLIAISGVWHPSSPAVNAKFQLNTEVSYVEEKDTES